MRTVGAVDQKQDVPRVTDRGKRGQILRDALDAVPQRAVRSIADVYQVDAEARERAKDFIRRLE